MARTDKSAEIALLTDLFREADAVLLTEYRGLSVKQMKTLRRSLGTDVRYHVTKNTLARIAAKEAGIEGIDDDLKGPTALAFVTGDIASAAKAFKNFAKENDKLVIKSGVMEGVRLDAAGVSQLADLESREVLLAKAAGALKATMVKAAFVFKAPALKTVRTVDALREKQETAA
ncbi:50S ribosomal protein L10 [Trueperella sp. LYQ143]|uniref:50S ribosomal protein L10 n=1 Tax=unclassified Trueperella TaxID=2630174 RepID=UPI003983767F